jgi:hypothetical protein
MLVLQPLIRQRGVAKSVLAGEMPKRLDERVSLRAREGMRL